MKKLKGILPAFVIMGIAASCGTEQNKSEPVTADTSVSNVTDNMVTEPVTDSTTAVVPADSPGTAKPNPSKKGLKGTVKAIIPAAKTGDKETTDKDGYYTNLRPSFPGGEKAIAGFFNENIEYPQQAINNGVEGTVYISFLVDETGKISNPMTNPPRLGYGLEEEAMRVFAKMPKWTPGSLKGKNVKTRFSLPVTFTLE